MASVSVLPSVQSHMHIRKDNVDQSNATKFSKTEDLKVLRQILHQGVDDLLQELERHGRKPPSLKPCNAEEVFAAPIGTEPRRNIIRTCEKMISLVQGPMWWMMQSAGGSAFPAVLDTTLELKLHQLISENRHAPTALSDLARDTGGSQELISWYSFFFFLKSCHELITFSARLLRYLTQRFVFEEVSPGYYTHNSNSSILKISGVEALMGTWYVRP